MRRDHGDRQARVILAHVTNEVDAVAIGQAHIGETEIERRFSGGRVGVAEIGHRSGVHVHALERDLDELTDVRLVVDNQGPGAIHVGSASCRLG